MATSMTDHTTREHERELLKAALARMDRNNHHMPADVPYWVEDFLEEGVGLLKATACGARSCTILALIIGLLYEIYAVMKGLPLLSGQSIINWFISAAAFGVLSGVMVWGMRGFPHDRPDEYEDL